MTMAVAIALDRVTSLGLGPWDHAVVRGLVTTWVDYTTFDAAFHWGGYDAGSPSPGGLFDLEAGGLRIVERHLERHEYVLQATGGPAPGCVAAGAPPPCLLPRLTPLAHERLRTRGEFAATLTGFVEVEGVAAVPAGAMASWAAGGFAMGAALLGVAAVAGLAGLRLRRGVTSPIRRVRSAARAALRATRGDATLECVRTHIRQMLGRARELETARRACARRLRALDPADLERRRAASTRSAAPDAREALAWIEAERAEATRLQNDLASSVVGLERIESALRVVTLRAREHRDTRARVAKGDPVDAVAAELARREQALAEADAAVD